MAPAKLPSDLIKKPDAVLADLAPGESGWIDFTDLAIDDEHCCYVNPEAKIRQRNPITIRATRAADGFEVLIPDQSVPDWTPGQYRPGSSYYGKWQPVAKIEREQKAQFDEERHAEVIREARRKRQAGEFNRKIAKITPVNLYNDRIELECGHTSVSSEASRRTDESIRELQFKVSGRASSPPPGEFCYRCAEEWIASHGAGSGGSS